MGVGPGELQLSIRQFGNGETHGQAMFEACELNTIKNFRAGWDLEVSKLGLSYGIKIPLTATFSGGHVAVPSRGDTVAFQGIPGNCWELAQRESASCPKPTSVMHASYCHLLIGSMILFCSCHAPRP